MYIWSQAMCKKGSLGDNTEIVASPLQENNSAFFGSHRIRITGLQRVFWHNKQYLRAKHFTFFVLFCKWVGIY